LDAPYDLLRLVKRMTLNLQLDGSSQLAVYAGVSTHFRGYIINP